MGLADQRQTAKNITDYRQNAKKNYRLPERGPTLSIYIYFFFQKEEYIVFFLPFQEETEDTMSQVFLQSYTLHARNAQINSFQFNGKLYLQTHRTAMGTKTAVSSANIFMSYIETQSLSS